MWNESNTKLVSELLNYEFNRRRNIETPCSSNNSVNSRQYKSIKIVEYGGKKSNHLMQISVRSISTGTKTVFRWQRNISNFSRSQQTFFLISFENNAVKTGLFLPNIEIKKLRHINRWLVLFWSVSAKWQMNIWKY